MRRTEIASLSSVVGGLLAVVMCIFSAPSKYFAAIGWFCAAGWAFVTFMDERWKRE